MKLSRTRNIVRQEICIRTGRDAQAVSAIGNTDEPAKTGADLVGHEIIDAGWREEPVVTNASELPSTSSLLLSV